MRLKELLYFNDGGKLSGLDNDLLGFHNELYKLFPNMVVTSGKECKMVLENLVIRVDII